MGGEWALLVIAIAGWIVYELYGRQFTEWMLQYTIYIRLAGGALLITYIWWQFRQGNTADTLDLAKQMLSEARSSSTREKRNVTNLMKKKVAAKQEWKCGHCKATLDETFEVDHMRALFNGGSNDESNLVALCPNCHRKKTVQERLAAS
jgi:5-methylcytosine-specific restriction enzyme A